MSESTLTSLDGHIPDFAQMHQLQAQAFEICNAWQDDILPGQREMCEQFRGAILDTERALREFLAEGLVLLENKIFASTSPASSRRVVEVCRPLASLCNKLAQQGLRVERLNLTGSNELQRLSGRVGELAQQTAQASQRLKILEQQLADINRAIYAFDKPSISKVFKGLIPSEAEIDAAVGLVTDPSFDAQLFKTISRKLRSHADILEGASTFRDLTRVRQRLQDSVDQARRSCDQAAASEATARRGLEANQALAGLGPIRDQWLAMLRKVETFWQASASSLGPELAPEKALIMLEDMYRYLQAVQQAYDRA